MKSMNKSLKEKMLGSASRVIGKRLSEVIDEEKNDCIIWLFDEPSMPKELVNEKLSK